MTNSVFSSKLTKIMGIFFAVLFFATPAFSLKSTTPDDVAALVSKLPENERLFVLVNAEVSSNIALAGIAVKSGQVHGSVDEEEALVMELSKARFMGQVAEKALPGKLTAYYADWEKTVKGYLAGNVTLHGFVNKRKTLHPALEKILKADIKLEDAQKYAKKHVNLIKELSITFLKPALDDVAKHQNNDIKNQSNFSNTKCLPVKDKWKKCGLTGDIKQQIKKINGKLAGGNASIYKTMRIGNKFAVYVFYNQSKKQMQETINELKKKQPATLQATYSLTALRALCEDTNFKQVLKKTKSIGQLIVHSRDPLPVYNLAFKDCSELTKYQTSEKK